MNWDEYGLNWWEKENVLHYSTPDLHPDYAGATSTADVEVQWFHVASSEHTIQSFSFDFFINKVFVGYKNKEKDGLHLSVGMHGWQKGSINPDEINPNQRCSVWLRNKKDLLQGGGSPAASLKFQLSKGFHIDLTFDSIPKNPVIGIYIMDWYW